MAELEARARKSGVALIILDWLEEAVEARPHITVEELLEQARREREAAVAEYCDERPTVRRGR